MFQVFGYVAGLVGLKALKKIILIPMAISVVGMVLSFYYFVISAIVSVYNQVHDFFDVLISNKNPAVSDFIYNLASSIGLLDGIYAGLPFIYSSIAFFLMSILYKYTIEVIKTLFYVSKTFL